MGRVLADFPPVTFRVRGSSFEFKSALTSTSLLLAAAASSIVELARTTSKGSSSIIILDWNIYPEQEIVNCLDCKLFGLNRLFVESRCGIDQLLFSARPPI